MNVNRQNVWQKVLAKDALYNNYRFTTSQYNNHNQLKNLYLKRRTQLSREYYQDLSIPNQDPQIRLNYYNIRKNLLAKKYGPLYTSHSDLGSNSIRSKSRTPSLQSLNRQMDLDLSDGLNPVTGVTNRSGSSGRWGEVVPTHKAPASRALAGNDSIAEGYAFAGIRHIFDHCKGPVSRIKFAHNDASRLAVSSEDGTLSICCTLPREECVVSVMKDTEYETEKMVNCGVTDLAWSNANDFIITSCRDSIARLWSIDSSKLARRYSLQEKNVNFRELLAVEFQPINNNLFIAGTNDGMVLVTNLSTGKPVRGGREKLGGRVSCLAFEQASGACLWAAGSSGAIQSYICDPGSGRLVRAKRLNVGGSVTSLQARAWISREARDPSLLANVACNSMLLFRVVSQDGQLVLKNRFPVTHNDSVANRSTDALASPVRSCFCPLISFRTGACVVSGSQDGNILVYDVTTGSGASQSQRNKHCVTVLQGHTGTVSDVIISCDESVLASCDDQGQVILWNRVSRQTVTQNNLIATPTDLDYSRD